MPTESELPKRWEDDVAELPESLTTREAATILRLHETTVRELASRGEVPAVRFGGQWRFVKTKLLRLLDVELPESSSPDSPPA